MERDAIIIHGLELSVRIGVPEEERAAWQTVSADIELELQPLFDSMQDELVDTVDYHAVTEEIKALAAARPRKLLETLATEVIAALLEHPKIASAQVELRKRILPGVNYVAVCTKRSRKHTSG